MVNMQSNVRVTGVVKEVANPTSVIIRNGVCKVNNRKQNTQDSNEIEKDSRKKRKIRGTGVSLPEDIIMDILPMLPAESLVRFRCVSKFWCNLLKTINFAKLQLDYTLKNRNDGILIEFNDKICYLDYDSLSLDSSLLHNKLVHIAYPVQYNKKEIIGTCNGLVCYRSYDEDIIIWNPCTKDYKKIPAPPEPISTVSYGFAYDAKSEDYILAVHVSDVISCIHVYSLKLDSWKTISNLPHELPCKKLVLFNGIFHWVDLLKRNHKCLKGMSCFDTADETVKHILLPEYFRHKFSAVQPCLLGGRLCIIGSLDRKTKEVWTMNDYGVAESWTELFTICKSKLLRLQDLEYLKQSFKNAGILVHQSDISTYLYDLDREVSTELVIDGILPGFKTWAFCGSLVSPN